MLQMNQHQRPQVFAWPDSGKAALPFEEAEYADRLAGLRQIMAAAGVEAVVLTSMHGVAFYSGFLYCSFGRPYACIVTPENAVTISAGIDGGQPARRSFCDNLVYTDWQRDNFWRAVLACLGKARRIGIEADHLTLAQEALLRDFIAPEAVVDIAPASMAQRLVKSEAEIALIREGARIADLGGEAIRDAIREGAREIDVAMAGRDAMELEIARAFPDSEIRDTWVWFQSGINTDGAHNPVTTRRLCKGDILSLNTFPMISGYYTALERTLFLGEPDAASLRIWEANVAAHELGLSLVRPGISCKEICNRINAFLAERDLLQYRSFGYGHSFGVLSHYYGREAGLELREGVETVLRPGHVVSMEPMLTLPEGQPAADGYREHDILVVMERGAENITRFPFGPGHNILRMRGSAKKLSSRPGEKERSVLEFRAQADPVDDGLEDQQEHDQRRDHRHPAEALAIGAEILLDLLDERAQTLRRLAEYVRLVEIRVLRFFAGSLSVMAAAFLRSPLRLRRFDISRSIQST